MGRQKMLTLVKSEYLQPTRALPTGNCVGLSDVSKLKQLRASRLAQHDLDQLHL